MNSIRNPAIWAFVGLVFIQTSVSIIYKFASTEGDGYSFSKAGSLALSELTKFMFSLGFLTVSLGGAGEVCDGRVALG